jgi:hypothetical protein
MRFRFIEDRRADYPVTIMCGVLGVSSAGYYAWRSRPESRRAAANRNLVDDIKRVHRDTHGRYGSPRIHVELKAQGRGVKGAGHRHCKSAISILLSEGVGCNLTSSQASGFTRNPGERSAFVRKLRAHDRRRCRTRTPRNLSSGQASRGPVGSAAPRSDGQSNAWPMTAGKTSMAGTSPAMTISRRGIDQGTAGQATSWI